MGQILAPTGGTPVTGQLTRAFSGAREGGLDSSQSHPEPVTVTRRRSHLEGLPAASSVTYRGQVRFFGVPRSWKFVSETIMRTTCGFPSLRDAGT